MLLKALPDLERLLNRIHTNGNKKKSLEHPDSRAVMYEFNTYNSRKIKDFIDVLIGFETIIKIIEVFKEKNNLMDSILLKRITQSSNVAHGKFPYDKMSELLLYFRSIFDEKQVKRDGNIKPLPGINPDYDKAKADIGNIESALQNYLKDMKKLTNLPELVYWGNNKDRYQIEVPMNKTNKIPSNWITKSQKKTHRRYVTPVIEELFDKLVHAEES